MPTKFSMPFRPNYEARAAVGWLTAISGMVVAGIILKLPFMFVFAVALLAILILTIRGWQAYKLWEFFLNLAGNPFQTITFDALDAKIKDAKDELWLGTGFNWTPKHTGLSMELLERDFREVAPPKWVARWMGKAISNREFVGQPWIHGIGSSEEKDVNVPLKFMEGNTTLVGMPGSGKTTLYRLLAFQAVRRGDCLIVCDPKNDRELENAIREACERAGKPEKFISFNPAHPTRSIRYDALANWSRTTEPASRITDVVTSMSGSADGFTAFAWSVLQSLADGLIYCDRRPTLKLFRALIDNGPDQLMEEAMKRFFLTAFGAEWPQKVAPFIRAAKESKTKSAISGSPELIGMVNAYKNIPMSERPSELNGLLDTVEHNREHLGKMLTSLKPALTALTSGDLGGLLSPDAADINDLRPIFDSAKIIEGGYVMYCGFDALTDGGIASALATLILSDFKSVAGSRYNYGSRETLSQRIEIIIDECAAIINIPLIDLLSKGRGSGMRIMIAMQSFADLITKLGSTAYMEMVLDNTVNLIALRSKGDTTGKQITRIIGKTRIEQVKGGMSSGTRSDDAGLHISGSESRSIDKQEVALFPEELLSRLPNFEYIAVLAGGNVVKGRFPILN